MVNIFEGLLALLVKNNVMLAVVGGVAVCLNGFLRTTEDLDILSIQHSESFELSTTVWARIRG